MSGYELAQRLRQKPVFDDVVLVALTGYGMEEDVQKARAAGFDDHLTKPLELDKIDKVFARPRWRTAS